MQHLRARAVWDTDGVGEDLRDYLVDSLGEAGAVLVIDETGDVKKGNRTVGVQRQYTGTAGRIENAQVAVYLSYAGARGHALIDRELYLPGSWIDGPGRCAALACPSRRGLPPSRRWPPRCSPARSTPGCRPGGWPVMRSTAPTPTCAHSWRPVGSATCWPSPATGGCPRPPGRSAPTSSLPPCHGGPGSGSRPDRAQRDSGTTTGPASSCQPPTVAPIGGTGGC